MAEKNWKKNNSKKIERKNFFLILIIVANIEKKGFCFIGFNTTVWYNEDDDQFLFYDNKV